MRVEELINHATTVAGVAREGAVPTNLFTLTLRELNRIYRDMYNLYPWDNVKIFNLSVTTTDGIVTFPQNVENIRAIRIDDQPIFPVSDVRVNNWAPSSFEDAGEAFAFLYLAMSPVLTQPAAAAAIRIASSSAADTALTGNVRIEGTVDGDDAAEEITLSGAGDVDGALLFSNIRQITKPKTTGRVTISTTAPVELGTIAPWDYQGNYQRVRLVPPVDTSTTVKCQVTRRFQELVSDDDSIVIPKAENGIISQLIGFLLKLQGNVESGQLHIQEGLESIKLAVFNESELNVKDHRSLPQDGMFGDLGVDGSSLHTNDTSVTGIGF